MTVENATAIVTSLRDGRWLQDEAAASAQLAALGFMGKPGSEAEPLPGLMQREFEGPAGIEQLSLSCLDGRPTTVTFFIGASPEPESAVTRSAYGSLIASLAASLGAPERVWPDRPMPVLWREGELDVGLQLFDRRDHSVVMVWIEHRVRSQDAEARFHAEENDRRTSG
jgi:hypothetical protein